MTELIDIFELAKGYKRKGLAFNAEAEKDVLERLEEEESTINAIYEEVWNFILPQTHCPSYLWGAVKKIQTGTFESGILYVCTLGTADYALDRFMIYQLEGGDNPLEAEYPCSTPGEALLSDYRKSQILGVEFKLLRGDLLLAEKEFAVLKKKFGMIEKPAITPEIPSWIYGLWLYVKDFQPKRLIDILKKYSTMQIVVNAVSDAVQRGELWYK